MQCHCTQTSSNKQVYLFWFVDAWGKTADFTLLRGGWNFELAMTFDVCT